MDNLVRTTELQENPDRGPFYHCPWLYWPTGIKYLDINFSIFLGQNGQYCQNYGTTGKSR